MEARSPALDRAAEGWRHLRAFFREGSGHLGAAVTALREAEQIQRRAGDREGLLATLLGLSLALRLSREPADARRAVTLAQEVVNLARRLQGESGEDSKRGEAIALPYRAYLEAALKDLGEAETGDARARAAEEGIEACDRTLRLARRLHVPAVIPPSQAAKAGLLLLLAEGRGPAEAARLRRQAARLYAAALDGWPSDDAEGRAAVQVEMAERLAPHLGARIPAERLLRDAERAFREAGNRYGLAGALRAQAKLALAAGRSDALDLLEAATAAFRELGREREAREVEHLL